MQVNEKASIVSLHTLHIWIVTEYTQLELGVCFTYKYTVAKLTTLHNARNIFSLYFVKYSL